MSLKENIDLNNLPHHVAVIMDGNGRWAKNKGKIRIFGHQHAIVAVRETIEACAELGIGYITMYAFSTENWNRPVFEVSALMELLVKTIRKETKTLMKNNIRLQAIGNLTQLPEKCGKELQECIEVTKNNTSTTLILALSYSAKLDIVNAVRKIASDVNSGSLKVDEINENEVNSRLSTASFPPPDLMIRTSGEHRISNFLLWELAYAEFYFTDTLWPDFRKEHLYEAILEYQKRERRFGKTSEQIKP
ncbi:MAG: isoprenyl transferase [Bacteroidetes bacterium]|nr:isoprenyl transferase [Bacteroidota bacterium]